MKKLLAVGLALLLLVLMLPMTAAAEGVDVDVEISTEADFRTALEKLTGLDSRVTVRLADNITISGGSLSVSQGTLTILGQGHTLCSSFHAILSGSGNAVVNLGAADGSDTLTLTSTDDTSCVVGMGDESKLNMYRGVTVKDSSAASQAGGIQLAGSAVFNMYGGMIDNCENTIFSAAGGVVVDESAAFYMRGGAIRGCSGYFGGGVVVQNGTFVMEDGEISGCTTTSANIGGGGVLVLGGASFTMKGGTITGNTTEGWGGGILAFSGNVTVADGVALYNNTAKKEGDDLYNIGANITLGKTADGLALSSCGHTIDGWYYDRINDQGATRWNCDEAVAGHAAAYDKTGELNSAECGLKAAHGELKSGGPVIIIVPDDTTTTTEKPANPATGANDFVGAAAALAVVSLLGMAVASRKK